LIFRNFTFKTVLEITHQPNKQPFITFMEIKFYTAPQLNELVDNASFWKTQIFPITKYRCQSQAANPRAEVTDIVLLIAYNNNKEIIGYLNILPDYFFIENVSQKIFWCSTIFGNNLENSNIEEQLIKEAMNCTNNKIAAVCGSENTKKLFSKNKEISVLKNFSGKEYFFREGKNSEIKKGKRNKLYNFIFPFWNIKNSISEKKQKKWIHKNFKDIHFEYLAEIDVETSLFIEKFRRNELICRGKTEFDWIVKYPWLLQTHADGLQQQRFHFSAETRIFERYFIKIFHQEQLSAFVMLQNKNNCLTMPYIYYKPNFLKYTAIAVAYHIHKLKIEKFSTYNEEFIKAYEELNFPKIKTYQLQNCFYLSQQLENTNINNYFLQDGDSDSVFT